MRQARTLHLLSAEHFTVDGTPHIGPTWAGLFARSIPLRGGGRVVADEAYLTESMMDPLARIHLGFLPVMPSYRGQLGAAQVGAAQVRAREVAAATKTAPTTGG